MLPLLLAAYDPPVPFRPHGVHLQVCAGGDVCHATGESPALSPNLRTKLAMRSSELYLFFIFSVLLGAGV